MKIPFVGGGYLGRSSNLDTQRCVNLYPELDKTGGKPECLIGTPGLLSLVTDGDLPGGGILITPVIVPATGSYDPSVTVSMSCATSGAVIRYTTDGSDPTGASTEYTVPIVITTTTTVKAKALKTGWTSSGIATKTYTLPGWTAYFNDTKWVVGGNFPYGSWDVGNQEWDTAYDGRANDTIGLTPIGGWEVGYRPSKIRVAHNGTLSGLWVRDTNLNIIYYSLTATYATGVEISLTFTTFDIDELILWKVGPGNDFSVTNIEFFGL